MIHLPRSKRTSLARKLLPLAATTVALIGGSGVAQAAGGPTVAGFESGGFNEFSQTGITSGTLNVTTERAYEGTHSAKATYDGSTNNGYARAIENISWAPDADVWYGAAYYLPTGYKASLKGGNDLIRWDNYPSYEKGGDYGGVELWTDGKARLLTGHYSNDPKVQLTGTFDVPEGRWFWLEVHQRFSTTSGSALNEVYIDGQKVGGSTTANTFGRAVERLRAGIVAISEGNQNVPLTLYVDRVSISDHQVGPIGGSPAAPSPGTAPAPKPGTTPSPGTAPAKGTHGRPHRHKHHRGHKAARHHTRHRTVRAHRGTARKHHRVTRKHTHHHRTSHHRRAHR